MSSCLTLLEVVELVLAQNYPVVLCICLIPHRRLRGSHSGHEPTQLFDADPLMSRSLFDALGAEKLMVFPTSYLIP
jgi:hypothetical protein